MCLESFNWRLLETFSLFIPGSMTESASGMLPSDRPEKEAEWKGSKP